MKKLYAIILLTLLSFSFAEETKMDSLQTKPKLIFMEFGSISCVPCIQMELVLDKIKEHYPSSVNVIFTNVKKNRTKSKEFKIKVIPTQVVLNENGKEIFRHQGYLPFKDIQKLFFQNGIKPETDQKPDTTQPEK